MLDLVKNFYRAFVEVALWFVLVVCIIVGFALGNTMDRAFMGAVLGMLVGVVVDVFLGGLVATFIAIEKNTAETLEAVNMLEVSINAKNNANGVPLKPNRNLAPDTFEVLDDSDTFEVTR